MEANPPPVPDFTPEVPRASLVAYVWRGDKFDEIGLGMTKGQGHLVRFALGVDQKEAIELRGVNSAYYPGYLIGPVLKPTFLAFFAGTETRAGTAWPHPDGKGHRLKLRHSLNDGAEVELRSSGDYSDSADNRRIRNRRPKHRPKING